MEYTWRSNETMDLDADFLDTFERCNWSATVDGWLNFEVYQIAMFVKSSKDSGQGLCE